MLSFVLRFCKIVLSRIDHLPFINVFQAFESGNNIFTKNIVSMQLIWALNSNCSSSFSFMHQKKNSGFKRSVTKLTLKKNGSHVDNIDNCINSKCQPSLVLVRVCICWSTISVSVIIVYEGCGSYLDQRFVLCNQKLTAGININVVSAEALSCIPDPVQLLLRVKIEL